MDIFFKKDPKFHHFAKCHASNSEVVAEVSFY